MLRLREAIKRPGRVREWAKRHGYSGVTLGAVMAMKRAAKERGDRSMLGAANLAYRLKWGDLASGRKGKRD